MTRKIHTQADITARETADYATYQKRTREAIRVLNSATHSWAIWNAGNAWWKREAARHYHDQWYRQVINRQAERLAIDERIIPAP